MLLDYLRHEEHWVRYQTKRILADLPTEQVVVAARQWVHSLDPMDSNYEHHLYELLGVYESHDVVETELLSRLLLAQEPRARAYATRAVGRWHDRLDDPLAILRRRIADDHSRVRLEAIVAASFVPSPESIEVATMALDKPMDPYLHHALTQAVHMLVPHWKPVFEKAFVSCWTLWIYRRPCVVA
jgi:hypothetical protein